MATVPAGTPVDPPRRRPRILGWLLSTIAAFVGFALLGIIGLGLLVAFTGSGTHLEEKYHSLDHHGTDKVAIITVEGLILGGHDFIKKQIDHIRDDKHVKAVVLRVDSPGGTITGSDFVYHHLLELKKDRKLPLVVSMGGIAASGGYYISMAVGDTPDSIYVEPTTWTGSIGVIIPHYDITGLMQTLKVEDDSIPSHPLKQMGSITKPMTPEERKIFEGLVHDSFDRFKQVVQAGRPKFRKAPKDLDKLATGQIFTAKQARDSGLVDREGFIEAAIDRAVELAGLDKSKTKAIEYKKPFNLLETFTSIESSVPSQGLAGLDELATPRAYYLWSSLPRGL